MTNQQHSIILRQWRDSDLEPFAAMNADADVMEFFPRLLTFDESSQLMQRFQQGITENGWGIWAIEVDGAFAGFTGLQVPKFSAHFTPCVEIGWRFHKAYWGRGIAFTAAQQAVDYALNELRLDELVSFTAAINVRSWKLMQRLGFSHDASEDFMHPLVEDGHPLKHHVLYRKKRV